MHDEGDLRAVSAAPRRSADRKDDVCLLVLQSGSAARPGRLHCARPAPAAEQRAGEANRAVDRSLLAQPASEAGAQSRLGLQTHITWGVATSVSITYWAGCARRCRTAPAAHPMPL